MILNPRDILIRPLITEKTTILKKENKYTFIVPLIVNKIQIRQAIENIFKVKVLKVSTTRVIGKIKRMGKNSGKRPDIKKAIVTLGSGEKIKFFESIS